MGARKHQLAAIGWMLVLAACRHETSTPLRQRAYVWQREWTPSVGSAILQAGPKLDGLIVLGAEIAWKNGEPRIVRPPVAWDALRGTGKPVGIALRIDPFSGALSAGDPRKRLFADMAKSLIAEANAHGVSCAEFQVDFDCAQRKLADYREWLETVREAARPVRMAITTLPAWLDEPEFAKLIAVVDGHVLQVHSVPTREEGERVALCDPARAQRWVAKAARLGRPFTVSLPTYSALVGYDQSGQRLGMALDGVQPSWPPGTRVVEFTSDAAALSQLVAGWRDRHPPAMEGVVWYRLPASTDARNWRWPTFAAVIEGRVPRRKLDVLMVGGNPVDLSLSNQGEAEEPLEVTVRVRWDGPGPVAADAIGGWTLALTAHEARFARANGATPRLLPGGRRGIGWLRFEQRASLHAEIIR